jgi:TolA-binding protein
MISMMRRRAWLVPAFVLLGLVVAPPAAALDDADRLWLVGERALADRLPTVARRALERFVAQHPDDPRFGAALLLLGRARLALGDGQSALEAFRRAQTLTPPPGRPLEARFWEAEALVALRRCGEARPVYDEIVRTDAASPLAPDALYGFGWCEHEQRRFDSAAGAFKQFLWAWPEHALAPAAMLHMARALIEAGRVAEALPLLQGFALKYPGSRHAADALYLGGWAKLGTGDPRGGLGDLRAFVQAHPAHPDAPAARRLITQTLAKYGDREELLEAYKGLMEQEPATAEGFHDAATIAARLGRARDREAAWKALREQFPEHPLTRRLALEMAADAFKRRQWKETATLATVATHSEETAVRAEAWLLLGEADLKLRRFKDAARAFEAVGALADVEAGVRYRALAGLGLAREEQQQLRSALAAYESVASRSPDSALREWARNRAAAVKGRLAPEPKKSNNEPSGNRS